MDISKYTQGNGFTIINVFGFALFLLTLVTLSAGVVQPSVPLFIGIAIVYPILLYGAYLLVYDEDEE